MVLKCMSWQNTCTTMGVLMIGLRNGLKRKNGC